MNNKKRILMVAAENDALPDAKVGGVGDVLRDLPPSLVAHGQNVDVVVPSYGFLARLPGLEAVATFDVAFVGRVEQANLLRLPEDNAGACNYILHHSLFSAHGETIYCDDDDDRPFASDATKFAFFCAAIAQAILEGHLPEPDVLHCHDWHTAFLFILIQYAPALASLKSIATVYTIHNLAMQGVRPFKHDESALETWFPGLLYDPRVICDPKIPHCLNPMRAAILFAGKVHTVSPTYAQEILRPSVPELGQYGGEGLEADLLSRQQQGDLLGIINGCSYPKTANLAAPAKKKLYLLAQENITRWASKDRHMRSVHFVADRRMQAWNQKKSRGFVLTYVGRLTEQKVRLLSTYVSSDRTAIEVILQILGEKNHLIMLGTGNRQYEDFMLNISGKNPNFIFLNGYAHELSETLFRYGDLFLMPSSFEPCGISQMFAMRAGQPCLVNRVGGLKDTIEDGVTGFTFEGEDAPSQAKAMVEKVRTLKEQFELAPENWKTYSRAAAEVRFTWDDSAEAYLEQLYQ